KGKKEETEKEDVPGYINNKKVKSA